MQTIKVILAESGRVANLKKDFPLYVGSYQNKLLNVLVPKSILAARFTSHYIDTDGVVKTGDGSYTAIKVGMTYLKRTGAIKQSNTFFLRYLKDVTVNNIEYSMYERQFPKEFTMFEGQGENAPRLVVNVVNVLVKTENNNLGTDTETTDDDWTFKRQYTTTEIITSQYAAIDVMYSADLEDEPEVCPTDMEIISGQVNGIIENLPSKLDSSKGLKVFSVLDELDLGYEFNKDAFKTKNVLFGDVSYKIKTTINGDEVDKIGAVIVTNIQSTQDYIYHTELFIYDSGVAERVITFNATNYEVIGVGDWQTKVDSQQEISDAGKFLYVDEQGRVNLTSAVKDFIVRLGTSTITDKASAFNFSTDFDITAEARGGDANLENVNIALSNAFKNRVSNLETDNTQNKEKIAAHDKEIEEKVAYTIGSSIDSNTYLMSFVLKNKKGSVIASTTLNLPLETMVIGASYENKTLTLTLKNGQKLNIDISALISGLVPDNRLINNKALTADITLTPADIGTYSSTQIDGFLRLKTNDADLAAVAKSGNYNDLKNTPNIPEGVEVVDNLTSSSTTASLSANQGRVLKAEIDKKQDKMTVDTALSTTSTNTVQNKVVTAEINKKLNTSGGTITGQLVLSKSTDLSGTSNNTPALIVGGLVTAQHLEFDGNEIQSKSNANTVGKLWINGDGGEVYVGTVALADSPNNQLIPQSNESKNLGSSSTKWKDGYFSGNVNVGTLSVASQYPHIKGAGTNVCISTNSAWDGTGGEFVFEAASLRPSATRKNKQSLIDWLNGTFSGTVSANLLSGNAVYNRASVNALTAASTWANNSKVPTLTTLAYWDGRFQTTNNASNLKYAQTPNLKDNSKRIATTEWVNTNFFQHTIYITNDALRLLLTIINRDSTEFTLTTLKKWLNSKGFNGKALAVPFYPVSGGAKSGYSSVYGISSNGTDDGVYNVFYQLDSGTTITQKYSFDGITDTIVSLGTLNE